MVQGKQLKGLAFPCEMVTIFQNRRKGWSHHSVGPGVIHGKGNCMGTRAAQQMVGRARRFWPRMQLHFNPGSSTNPPSELGERE